MVLTIKIAHIPSHTGNPGIRRGLEDVHVLGINVADIL